ncbi:MAG TPA: ribonuclease P protein component [bacterium]|nr:ribonuclease P protein component [bacterium]
MAAAVRSITGGESFQRAFRRGGRAWQDFLQLRHLKTEGPTRIGVVLRASTFKRAARRNRIRRLIREAYRMLAPEVAPGYDLVFVPASEPAIDHRDYVLAVLARLLRRAGVYAGQVPPYPEGLKRNRRAPVESPPGSADAAAVSEGKAAKQRARGRVASRGNSG